MYMSNDSNLFSLILSNTHAHRREGGEFQQLASELEQMLGSSFDNARQACVCVYVWIFICAYIYAYMYVHINICIHIHWSCG